MKKLIIFLLLFSFFASFGKTTDSVKVMKFQIGISFSPDYSYRNIISDANNKSIKDMRDSLEVPKLGYTTGINLAYHLNKKIVLETGILFSDKGEKTKKISLADAPSGQLPFYYIYDYHYYYIDIPLKANYYIISGKCKVYVAAGISTNIFLVQKTTLLQGHNNNDYQKTSSAFSPGFNKFNFGLLAGAGISCKMTDKLDFKAEPIYTRSITSIINAPIKSYLYSAGLNIGIYYKL